MNFNMIRLRKGLKCKECHAFDWRALSSNLGICDACGSIMGIDLMVRDYFRAFNLILPGQQYKRRDIIDHLRINVSEYKLQKLIRSNFKKQDRKERIYYFSP